MMLTQRKSYQTFTVLVLLVYDLQVRFILVLTSSSKKKKMQKSLSLEKKMEILTTIDDGKLKKSEIAQKFGIAKSTLSTILKNREKIECACAANEFEPSRKRMRNAKSEEVEIALVRWIREIRAQNVPLTGAILQEKARFFADALNVSDFQCSSGWLQRFKDRHGIVCKKVCGEEGSVNVETVDDFLTNKLPTILKNYAISDIYNADETAIFWKALPSRTLSFKDQKCSGGKCSKERLTVLVACNMDGSEKLPLLVIGKSSHPRCFKSLKTLPVKYESTKKAWMTAEIFTKWVKELDRKFQQQGRKICLLLDNCSAHIPICGLKSIQLEFLPPGTTSRLQPCDQGVIRSMKAFYRRELIRNTIHCFDEKKEFKINLLDALMLLRTAWREVTSITIKNCFIKAGFRGNDVAENTKDEMEFDFMNAARVCGVFPDCVTFNEYVSMDNDVLTCGITTDDEIVNSVNDMMKRSSDDGNNNHYFSDTDEDLEENDTSIENPVSLMEAFTALQTVRRFVMQEAECGKSLETVERLDEFWRNCSNKKRKQSTITDFFKLNSTQKM